MTDYITTSGTIHWDRAEPFIWLLSEYENEVFKNRIDQIKDKRKRPKIVSVTEDTVVENERELVRSNIITQNNFKDKLFQKKIAKVDKLKIKGDSKKYKRYLLTKIFKEDDSNLPKYKKIERATILAKLKVARQK
jgi:5'-3' exonuclease